MGNDLAQFQNRMTAENWEFLLTMLQNTTDKIFVKRKVDNLLKDAKVVDRQPGVDVYDPTVGPGNVVLGRIRPIDRRPKQTKKFNNNMAFNFGTGKAERGVVSPAVLETLPEAWSEQSIKAAQENLLKLKNESKTKQPSTTPLDKNTEIIPPKPENGEAWTALHHWTVFGHLPNLNIEETREAIAKLTEGVQKTQIEDRAFVFKKHNGIIGSILPDAASERSLLNLIKEKEETENPPSSLSAVENPPSTPTKAESEEKVEGTKKKRKRKHKKRASESEKT